MAWVTGFLAEPAASSKIPPKILARSLTLGLLRALCRGARPGRRSASAPPEHDLPAFQGYCNMLRREELQTRVVLAGDAARSTALRGSREAPTSRSPDNLENQAAGNGTLGLRSYRRVDLLMVRRGQWRPTPWCQPSMLPLYWSLLPPSDRAGQVVAYGGNLLCPASGEHLMS